MLHSGSLKKWHGLSSLGRRHSPDVSKVGGASFTLTEQGTRRQVVWQNGSLFSAEFIRAAQGASHALLCVIVNFCALSLV